MRELLAAYAHAAWSGWMQYMFSKSMTNSDGSVTIPPDLVRRWTRQMNTLYADLPESEKRSDLEEAEKVIKIIADYIRTLQAKVDLREGTIDIIQELSHEDENRN